MGSTQETLSILTNYKINTDYNALTDDDNDAKNTTDISSSTENTHISSIAPYYPAFVSTEAHSASGGRDSLFSFLSTQLYSAATFVLYTPSTMLTCTSHDPYSTAEQPCTLSTHTPISLLSHFLPLNTINNYYDDDNN